MLSSAPGKTKYLLLDGHNNPGVSGGPIIFLPHGQLQNARVAGVIFGYRFVWDKVFIQDKETDFAVKYNTGIVVAYSIDYAVELIRANPIGAPVGHPMPDMALQGALRDKAAQRP